MLTDIRERCFVSLCPRLLLLSGTMGGGGLPMGGEELTVLRREGRVSSSGWGCRRQGALPFRITLIISSFRSTSESSNNELSYSSPVLVLMLVPLLRKGPACRETVSVSWRIDMGLRLAAPERRS